jgi:outer membrane protein assembly factor BamB
MRAAPAKSIVDGNLTAGNTLEAAGEILNEMQRSRGGDKLIEDHSRYQVTLKRPGEAKTWTGEVVGPPRLYPLKTVTILASEKQVLALDQDLKKLWQSALTYNVTGTLTQDLEEQDGSISYGEGPCVEHKDSVYVIDEGVLTAFDRASGNARWRLPSVGLAGMFFDDQEMMYINSTTASHDSLKYKRQIDLSQKAVSVVLKVDPRNGKMLWSAQPAGLVNYVCGKFVYSVQSNVPDEEEDLSPYRVDTGLEKPPFIHIRRLNPKNGHIMWEYVEDRAPLDVAFDKNVIRIVFKKEVEVLKFLTF